MIKNIKITNFYSIGATQELSFEISSKDVLDKSAKELSESLNINLVSCIIGHNASGKTTVLKALACIFWLINDSYTSMKANEDIPIRPHELHSDESTIFEIEFFHRNNFYQYIVELNRETIHKEYFGKRFVRGYSRIFEYERDVKDWNFNSTKIQINKSDLNRFKERKNVSVLGSLIETGYLPELSFLQHVESNVTNLGHFPNHPFKEFIEVSESFHSDVRLQTDALRFIDDIDIGIANFEFIVDPAVKEKSATGTKYQHFLKCVHICDIGNFTLPLIEESSGTRHGLLLLTEIIPILRKGGIVIIDEIESGLHPYVVKKLIFLFEDPETNPNNAQLIFSTHQHLLLNDRTKTQIFIAEKDSANFETEIYRLDNVEGVRNSENFFDKYLSGSYGGIANIKWVNLDNG